VSRPRLLVVGCTRNKNQAQGVMPARHRYTGRVFQALDRFEVEGLLSDVTLAILSARYGLLASDEPIDWYDQLMTPARARDLRPAVTRRLEALCSGPPGQAVFLWLEPVYLAAVDASRLPHPPGIERRLPPEGTGTVQAWLAANS
jgi:hypothetical protein